MPVTIGSEGGSNKHRCYLDITHCRFSSVKLSLDGDEGDDNHVVIKILIIIAHIVAVSCSGGILIILWCCKSGRFVLSLTFTVPCIVIYSYNKSQQDALFLKFILIKNSTCFGQIYCWLSASRQSSSYLYVFYYYHILSYSLGSFFINIWLYSFLML
jgi:hypothetical protein